ncbi:hypothetical protein K431DRAFT_286016 [Polychaeton citri CBS 116435]|uniref:Zn(2)-C6 fungal-type domain-containing protein n=1 Tax=Polychaeton citri CBS 116435 TaxID=1314669 RepID=A0A9P4Q8J7_9PEZI|nr:hypothetical protein K431DRAFT_286016 [Polychaeton citri CBS 116435]
MESSAVTTRTARACEPCRRKKSKCSGERPVCSCCQRLAQTCFYRDPENDAFDTRKRRRTGPSATSTESTESRLAKLEAKLQEISGDFVSPQALPRRHNQAGAFNEAGADGTDLTFGGERQAEQFDAASWLTRNTLLSFDDLVEIYAQHFHGQPLLLFDLTEIASDARKWPLHLVFSFLALISPYAAHDINASSLAHSAHCAIDYARTDVGERTQNVQSLCLLALWGISRGEATSASLHIGVAQMLSMQLLKSSQSRGPKPLDVQRCWFSAMILACMYRKEPLPGYSLPDLTQYPDIAISPPHPRLRGPNGIDAPGSAHNNWPHDMGVYAVCIDLYALWAKAMAFSESVRKGQTSNFWCAQSLYHEIRTAIFEFETCMSSNHRLRESGFATYPPEKVRKSEHYWRLWFISQVLFHAVQVMINHPLIHIINGNRLHKFQPPSFQQQTIDQLLLHAKWTVRLDQMRVAKGLRLDDPFIIYLFAMVATAYAFFLDSKDPNVKRDAKNGFEHCQKLVALHAQSFNHLKRTCTLLENLVPKSVAIDASPVRRTADVARLWDLLDYPRATSPEELESSTQILDLDMTTQFTSPLDEPDAHGVEGEKNYPSVNLPRNDANYTLNNAYDPWAAALNATFFTGLPTASAPNLDADFWFNPGQL